MSSSAKDNLPTSKLLGKLATEAGEITLKYFRTNFELNEKEANQGIVTIADLQSEKLITDYIKKHYPSHAIIAEESGINNLLSSDKEQFVWIIDPLDGTNNFSKGNIYYCISIAFGKITNGVCEILAAAIYHPPLRDLYLADKGLGAFINGMRMHIKGDLEPRLSCFCTGFSSNKGDVLRSVIENIFIFQNSCLGLRINGAAALDLAHTARGVYQGFFERTLYSWDMAAGELLVREAGGIVTNYTDNKFNVLQDNNIICCHLNYKEYILNNLKKSEEK